MKEMVLYYTPEPSDRVAKLKSVLVRMGVRIKNITPEQLEEKVGYLAGLEGFEPKETAAEPAQEVPTIQEEVLVMKNFTGNRIDELLFQLRKAGVSKIELKAVVTESNSNWTFYELYREIREEHEKMTAVHIREER